MGLALEQVEREAEIVGVVILGCPDPELGGAIKVIRYAHAGIYRRLLLIGIQSWPGKELHGPRIFGVVWA